MLPEDYAERCKPYLFAKETNTNNTNNTSPGDSAPLAHDNRFRDTVHIVKKFLPDLDESDISQDKSIDKNNNDVKAVDHSNTDVKILDLAKNNDFDKSQFEHLVEPMSNVSVPLKDSNSVVSIAPTLAAEVSSQPLPDATLKGECATAPAPAPAPLLPLGTPSAGPAILPTPVPIEPENVKIINLPMSFDVKTLAELKELCKKQGLRQTGSKKDLINRLEHFEKTKASVVLNDSDPGVLRAQVPAVGSALAPS